MFQTTSFLKLEKIKVISLIFPRRNLESFIQFIQLKIVLNGKKLKY